MLLFADAMSSCDCFNAKVDEHVKYLVIKETTDW